MEKPAVSSSEPRSQFEKLVGVSENSKWILEWCQRSSPEAIQALKVNVVYYF